MPKYVIEREIPRVGTLSSGDVRAAAQKSCGVLREMGPRIQWLESFVTADKLYCVYIADDEQAVREHAKSSGFPASSVAEVRRIIGPTTAE